MSTFPRIERLPPYVFNITGELKMAARRRGEDIIDMSMGNPDGATPPHIVEKLIEAVNRPNTHGYSVSKGIPRLRKAISDWYARRYDVKIDVSSEAMLLIGSKEGLAHLCWAIIDPGDISLVPDPGYTVYKVNTLMAGGEIEIMPLIEKNGFLPDLTAIPTESARRAKLMFLNYPNNPTGAVANIEFYRDVVKFAREYDIAVCCDQAYSEVTFDGYTSPSALQIEGAKDVVIEMYSLSKSHNMTGWRIGFAVGNPDILGALNKMKSNVDSRQFPAISLAASHALLNVDNSKTLDLYRRRRDILVDGLRELGWQVPKPQASLYVWAPVPAGLSSADFAKTLLQDAGVLVIPGNGYGQYGEGYVRMSLTVSGDTGGDRVQEGVRRIREAKLSF